MKARVVKIGNSQGIRIPKPILEQTGIMEDVELEIEKNHIIIRPISKARVGWDIAFKTMSEKNEAVWIHATENISNSWDEEEWQW